MKQNIHIYIILIATSILLFTGAFLVTKFNKTDFMGNNIIDPSSGTIKDKENNGSQSDPKENKDDKKDDNE